MQLTVLLNRRAYLSGAALDVVDSISVRSQVTLSQTLQRQRVHSVVADLPEDGRQLVAVPCVGEKQRARGNVPCTFMAGGQLQYLRV